MVQYGTHVTAGVTPGKGGGDFNDIPIFDTVEEAVQTTGATASVIYVPALSAGDAILEAADAGIALIVCITEGIPTRDMARVKARLEERRCILIGPNCPGVITPGQCKIGIMPGYIHTPGRVGVVSRSGTLTYEAVWQLTALGIGQSTCVGIGGDPIPGTTFVDILARFEEDDGTDLVVLIGEIGGGAEQDAARFIHRQMTKPIVVFVAGRTAPRGTRMGHAGAIISGASETAEAKIEMLRQAGAHMVDSPARIGAVVQAVRESQTSPAETC
jgi:succinyl-CoA synthetase alpha subunit